MKIFIAVKMSGDGLGVKEVRAFYKKPTIKEDGVTVFEVKLEDFNSLKQ